MEAFTVSWGFLGIMTFVVGLIHWLRRGKIEGIPEPPGNFAFGHAFQMRGNVSKTLMEWKNVVGPVFQLRFFNTRFVVFNDRESIAKVCSMPQASGRPRTGLSRMAFDILGEGVVFGEGPRWVEQRSTFVSSLRTFGIDSPGSIRRFQDEIADIMGEWEELKGMPFELQGCNLNYVSNALWSVIASNRMGQSDISKLSHNMQMIARMDTVGHKLCLLSTDLVEKFSDAVKVKRQGLEALATVAREEVISHRKDRVPNEPRDVIDQFLDKMDATDDVNSPFHKNNMKTGFALGDTLGAAIDTASNTLEWLMLYVAQHPEVTSKLHAEIDRMFGGDLESWPSLADREMMPYTQACILEASRIGSVLPVGVLHKALEDFEFDGARIPKGTMLVMNLYGVHHDPQAWDRPEEFRPERFLTPEGDNIDLNSKNKVIAFGLGRRVCPGNSLAMDSMFLYVVNVFRKFSFEVVGNVDSCEGTFGFIRHPPKGLKLRAISRFTDF